MLCNSKLEDDNPLPHSERMLIMVFYPVSAFSLLLCLAITVSTHHLRTSMFGYMKISLLISMSAFFTVMTMMNYGGVELILNYPLLCRASGFMVNFSFLSSFFWLNTMSFDIWKTFRHMRAYGSMIQRIQSRRRRVILYSIYAWGCPALITLLSLLVTPSSTSTTMANTTSTTR